MLACTLPVASGNALANTPTFDRPGIAFFTSIIPRESFAYELGLPNFLHASDAGSKSRLYSLDNNVRASLGEKKRAAARNVIIQLFEDEGRRGF